MKSAALLTFVLALSAAAADQVVVIAHRGEHLHHVENTLGAFQSAIEAGADYFECDVRTSSDGHFVLMHDPSVDRTTNGHGRVAGLTFEQIRALDAGGNRVPSFEEALSLAAGRIGVYVDNKQTEASQLVAAIEHAGIGATVVIYTSPDEAVRIHALRPTWKLMPEANNARHLQQLIDSLRLRVAAFDARDFNPETLGVARKAGIDIYVDRLGAYDNEAGWQAAIDDGATGIQTDHPRELVRYLRAHGRHR
jgi:glycerophosphoryl diester phosphodiesterase